jgi:hypothetical protein
MALSAFGVDHGEPISKARHEDAYKLGRSEARLGGRKQAHHLASSIGRNQGSLPKGMQFSRSERVAMHAGATSVRAGRGAHFKEGVRFGREEVDDGRTRGKSRRKAVGDTHRIAGSINRGQKAGDLDHVFSRRGLAGMHVGAETKRVSKAAEAAGKPIELAFKKIVPKAPTGPGSQRGQMSASAWESRTAAARRAQ